MGRFKDTNWNCGNGESVDSVEHAQLAVMMDIRDELKQLNRTRYWKASKKTTNSILSILIIRNR